MKPGWAQPVPSRGSGQAKPLARTCVREQKKVRGWVKRQRLGPARAMSAAVHYCQTCQTRAVVVGSANPEHCAGKYPFHCCCQCAVAVGWKGWQVCAVCCARLRGCAHVHARVPFTHGTRASGRAAQENACAHCMSRATADSGARPALRHSPDSTDIEEDEDEVCFCARGCACHLCVRAPAGEASRWWTAPAGERRGNKDAERGEARGAWSDTHVRVGVGSKTTGPGPGHAG